jgi:UDP-GlcNAc3NAcA epimerase
MKIVSVVGARPQFIKEFVMARAFQSEGGCQQVLVHTGQHYDDALSGAFFRELGLRSPDYNLGVGSGPHGAQTGAMLVGIERILLTERPDLVLVYGDTNSTLAGALVAAKLQLPIAHVEAGLRSFRRDMPEEVNRVLTDHISDLLFAPTQVAVRNLALEGVATGVHLVGDVMLDALRMMLPLAERHSPVLQRLGLSSRSYGLATIHRASNTDDIHRLWQLITALGGVDGLIVIPLHPRTRAALDASGPRHVPENLRLIEPVGYMDMLVLEKHASCVYTDSGGVQKEAYCLAVPCVTLREETEWIETLHDGWNVLAGADPRAIRCASRRRPAAEQPAPIFGLGDAGRRIATIIKKFISNDQRTRAVA